jgi:hypothetical protein
MRAVVYDEGGGTEDTYLKLRTHDERADLMTTRRSSRLLPAASATAPPSPTNLLSCFWSASENSVYRSMTSCRWVMLVLCAVLLSGWPCTLSLSLSLSPLSLSLSLSHSLSTSSYDMAVTDYISSLFY